MECWKRPVQIAMRHVIMHIAFLRAVVEHSHAEGLGVYEYGLLGAGFGDTDDFKSYMEGYEPSARDLLIAIHDHRLPRSRSL